MHQKKKIILVTPFISSFIKNDIAILSKEYTVRINIYNWKLKYLAPIFLLHQMFFLLKNTWFSEKIIIEFGGYWSLLPSFFGKIFGVPVFIVLHGTDCASVPSINYGSLRKLFVRLFCKYSYQLATVLLPVSSSLVSTVNTYYTNDKFSSQGFKYFFPEVKTCYQVIHNGVDEKFWKQSNEIIKEKKSFIAVFSKAQFMLKGGDLIISVADKFKECKFYFAGLDKPKNLNRIPENVVFLGKLSQGELRNYFNKSQYYFQLSIFEGFGLALCEAMLCECIPIGSSVNIIPYIIGNTGFILKKKNTHDLVNLIEKSILMEEKAKMGKKARNRVMNKFSLNKRIKDLLLTINSYN